jgi:polyphosphate glucokinase
MDKDPLAIGHLAAKTTPPHDAHREQPSARSSDSASPRTLAVDVGGSHVKATVLSADGAPVRDEVLIATPHPCPPAALLKIIDTLIASLPKFDRVSVGFPGYVRRGTIVTAPHLGTRYWENFDLEHELTRVLGRPARVLNDADVQGFGLIEGHGLEMVLTLGTGVGSALFRDGELMPHLELAHHPIRKGQTYDEYIGNAALKRKGARRWSRRVHKTIAIVRALVHYDILHIGGGNARRLIEPPREVRIGANTAGLTGGIRLWDNSIRG